ncbi:MAG: MFS transporter [Peptococcaceae bacterium]|nr:MFS transporter [Peptococcaceae bacterium]
MNGAEKIIQTLDQSKLTSNHYKVIITCIFADMLEFFDYFLIGFVLSLILGDWNITFGQTAFILLSAGVGAMFGPIVFGHLADKFGRRSVFMITLLVFSVGSGLMFFTPHEGWIYLSVLRFIVGFGVGGLFSVDLPLVQEYVPSRMRGQVTGIITAFIPVGILLGSLSAGFLTDIVGWRGVLLVGAVPALLLIAIRAWIPESPRWLIYKKNDLEQAAKSAGWITKTKNLVEEIKALPSENTVVSKVFEISKLTDLLKYPRSCIAGWGLYFFHAICYYGVVLWAPTIVARTMELPATEAARWFIIVTCTGVFGRFLWAFMGERFGRKICIILTTVIGAALVITAGVYQPAWWGPIPAVIVIMAIMYFFMDGGLAAVSMFIIEQWPQKLRASGLGSSYGIGSGLGKIIGPMILAFVAGQQNFVSPALVTEAVAPSYIVMGLFLACCFIPVLFGIEGRGKSIEQMEKLIENRRLKESKKRAA